METNASRLKERAEELGERIKERAAPVDEWVRAAVNEHPLLALAGALGVGYVIGRLIKGAARTS